MITDKQEVRRIKSAAHKLSPSVRIGKSGVTKAIIDEISNQLDKKKLIKVKVLKMSRTEMTLLSKEISELTDSEVIDRRGNIIVLWRKG